MKKMNKILLIISGICGGLGIVFLLIGLILGINKEQLLRSFSIQSHELGWFHEDETVKHWEEDAEDLDMSQWRAEEFFDVKKLNVDMGVGYLDIREYDGRNIEVYVLENDANTEVSQDGRELKIKQKGKVHHWFGGKLRPVKIRIPEDYIFEDVDIEIGAGEGKIESVKTDEIQAEIGAGSLEITGEILAAKSEWSVGAGSLELAHLMSRKTELECAVGEIHATLEGTESDYRMKADIGVGSLQFGSSEWEGLGRDVELGDSSKENEVSIKCGTGEISVDFTE